ncbi:MAG: diacylglycerol kinase family lipid kinase [Pyrinomonadaceae bacterium]|nr:diacylglycerol kinase family lipid kinase [Pyrinomonadaceae bacterium]
MLKRTKQNLSSKVNPKLPLVIVNPKSAGGATKGNWSGIASDLRAHFGAFQVAFTKSGGDGITLAKEAAENGRGFIVACGGDGTINEVANGIMQAGDTEIEMGIFPSGTGGDFRKTLGIPVEARKAAKALREGETKRIDLGKVTYMNSKQIYESRYFLNVSSFGLSAEINQRVSSNSFFKWLPFGKTLKGKAKFAYSTVQEVLEFDATLVNVIVDDGETKTLQTLNFCVCNGRFFGGGMKIAPNAKIDDERLNLINIGDIKTARILRKGYKLYTGSHLDLPEVKDALIKKVQVSPADENESTRIEADGEILGTLPATFEIVPKALKMRIAREEN